MSLYKDQEKLASVYHFDDSDSTKKGNYPATADFTIKMFIIRRNEDTVAILGQEVGAYVSNVNAKYTNASNIRKGDMIVYDGGTYFVTNSPRKNILFNSYKLILRKK